VFPIAVHEEKEENSSRLPNCHLCVRSSLLPISPSVQFRQRNDFQHKLSRKLVNRYALMAMESLNVRNMSASAKGTVEQLGKKMYGRKPG
jgi:transposase